MTFDQATIAFQGTATTQHVELRQDLIEAAVRYAGARCAWYLADTEQRAEMDPARTVAHNAFIDACNILGRQMARTGEATVWRERLGTDRKEIGDWACYVALFVGLAAR